MAQRRMFSLRIVDSDAFLDMGAGSQLLYFHLSMRADDDGFVGNPKKIMRAVGANEDDLKVLIAKRFILTFNNGVIVIKHWKMHNYIQNDRYLETQYLDEKKSLITKENGSYTECIQNVSKMEAQVRLELGKDRLGKDRLGESIYGEHKNVKLSIEEYNKLKESIGDKNTILLIEELSSYMASKGKKYSSHYATLQNWARRRIQEHSEKLSIKKRTII